MTITNVNDEFKLSKPSTIIPIPDFFKGKHIFVTGATGFMGKVFVEKLLWSCNDIGNIYILVRSKKGVLPSERIKDYITLPAFERLQVNNPSALLKIIPIAGDLSEKNLGISDEDRHILETKISIICHAAASVRFDDPIKKAILLNVRGTRDVVELARNCKKLEVLTYVSTTYCNCDREVIEEHVYRADYDWKTMLKLVETEDEHTLNILQPKILGNKPNTYTFSKQLAENIIHDYSEEIPSLIFRPSIVTFCMAEPIPGYIENLNGPFATFAGVMSGVLHVVYGTASPVVDFIPCDYAINGLIAATWYRGICNSNECQVVNGASGKKKNYSYSTVNDSKYEVLEKVPLSTMMWFPTLLATTNNLIYYIMVVFTHILPGTLVDIVLRIKGINFSLMRVYRKIFLSNRALLYFIMNEWKMLTDNYESLASFMLPKDRVNFNFNVDDITEKEAIHLGAIGIKRFIFKEDMSESALAADRKKFKRFYWVHQILRFLLFSLIAWLLLKFVLNHYT